MLSNRGGVLPPPRTGKDELQTNTGNKMNEDKTVEEIDTSEINVTTGPERVIVIGATVLGSGEKAKTAHELKLTIGEVFDMVDRSIINRDQAFRIIFKNERPDYRLGL